MSGHPDNWRIGQHIEVGGEQCVIVLREQMVDIYEALKRLVRMSQWTIDEFVEMPPDQRDFRSEMFEHAETALLFAGNYVSKADRDAVMQRLKASRATSEEGRGE